MDEKRLYAGSSKEQGKRLIILFESGFRKGFEQALRYVFKPFQFYHDMKYRGYCNIIEHISNPGTRIRNPGDNLSARLRRFL